MGEDATTEIENTAQATAMPVPAVPAPPGPMDLLAQAIDKGIDADALKAMMALQERYEANEAKKAYVVAMAAFKQEAPAVLNKDGEVSFGTTQYKHATLGSACEQLTPLLSKHGFAVAWPTPKQENGKITVACRITHELGHSEETALTGPYDQTGNKNALQAIGSASSYLARYTFFLALGIATAEIEDDDGIHAGPRPEASPGDFGPLPEAHPLQRENSVSEPSQAPPAASQGGEDPLCPECGGPMWDNRENKRNPKAPDFKCKRGPKKKDAPGCKGVIWPPKQEAPDMDLEDYPRGDNAPVCNYCGTQTRAVPDESTGEMVHRCPGCDPAPDSKSAIHQAASSVKAAATERMNHGRETPLNHTERVRRQWSLYSLYWNRSKTSMSVASLQEMADSIPALQDCNTCGTSARDGVDPCLDCDGIGYTLAPNVVKGLQEVMS